MAISLILFSRSTIWLYLTVLPFYRCLRKTGSVYVKVFTKKKKNAALARAGLCYRTFASIINIVFNFNLLKPFIIHLCVRKNIVHRAKVFSKGICDGHTANDSCPLDRQCSTFQGKFGQEVLTESTRLLTGFQIIINGPSKG